MQIISLFFIIFFLSCYIAYRSVATQKNHIPLLFASLTFVLLFGIDTLVILLGISFLSFFAAFLLEKKHTPILLFISVLICLSPLLIIKYADLFLYICERTLVFFGTDVSFGYFEFLQPAGISFYSFRVISYLADIYKGKSTAQKSFSKYCLYVSFFPEFLSGPIEREGDFRANINKKYEFDYSTYAEAFRMILFGVFKKVVIADCISRIISPVFSDLPSYGSLWVLVSVFMYSVQIYCDFSGYSDLAAGAAILFGFRPPYNFMTPYFATNIKDFWNRWHVSLSSFFRDYVYIPLGGNRKGIPRQYLNFMIVFLVSGLWHGAGISFILWGALHGVYMIIYDIFKKLKKKYCKEAKSCKTTSVVSGIFTFLLVSFAWIFFRAESMTESVNTVNALLSFKDGASINMSTAEILRIGLGTLFIFIYEFIGRRTRPEKKLNSIPLYLRMAIYMAVVFTVLLFISGSGAEFVYFNF